MSTRMKNEKSVVIVSIAHKKSPIFDEITVVWNTFAAENFRSIVEEPSNHYNNESTFQPINLHYKYQIIHHTL